MPETLDTLRSDVQRRLNDVAATVWLPDEIERYLETGYGELAQRVRVFWDQLYFESLPAGFTCTSPHELAYAGFQYGIVANYTCPEEAGLLDERHQYGPANHTCPAEALPRTTEPLYRDLWASSGTWGLLRDVTDLNAGAVTGTWGTPRGITGQTPMGDAPHWGGVRTIYVGSGAIIFVEGSTISYLEAAGGSMAVPATNELPVTVTEIERGLWDGRGLDALQPQQVTDPWFETARGELYGYLYRRDGIRTIRKVRIPSGIGDTYAIEGTWGALRDVTDLDAGEAISGDGLAVATFSYGEAYDASGTWGLLRSTAAVSLDSTTGTWGTPRGIPGHDLAPVGLTPGWGGVRRVYVGNGETTITPRPWGLPRRVPGHHPIGTNVWWGSARRVIREGKHVRFDHWRQGRALDDPDGSELPDRFAHALRDFAQARCLAREGPGQNLTLSAYYQDRWERSVARLHRRTTRVAQDRVGVLGGGSRTMRPPLRGPRPLNRPAVTV